MAQSRSSGGRRELRCGGGWPLFISEAFTSQPRAQQAPAQAHSHRLRCWRETAGGSLATLDQFFANKLTPLWSSLCWHSLASALPRKSPFPLVLAKLMLIELSSWKLGAKQGLSAGSQRQIWHFLDVKFQRLQLLKLQASMRLRGCRRSMTYLLSIGCNGGQLIWIGFNPGGLIGLGAGRGMVVPSTVCRAWGPIFLPGCGRNRATSCR